MGEGELGTKVHETGLRGLLRYIFIGISGALVGYAGFGALMTVGFFYQNYWLASIVIVGVWGPVAYLLHSRFVFASRPRLSQSMHFVGVQIVLVITSPFALVAFVEWLNFNRQMAYGVVLVLSALSSYLLTKFWVFSMGNQPMIWALSQKSKGERA
jgi:putative flippase GtrA